jgi:hypothetical protein
MRFDEILTVPSACSGVCRYLLHHPTFPREATCGDFFPFDGFSGDSLPLQLARDNFYKIVGPNVSITGISAVSSNGQAATSARVSFT